MDAVLSDDGEKIRPYLHEQFEPIQVLEKLMLCAEECNAGSLSVERLIEIVYSPFLKLLQFRDGQPDKGTEQSEPENQSSILRRRQENLRSEVLQIWARQLREMMEGAIYVDPQGVCRATPLVIASKRSRIVKTLLHKNYVQVSNEAAHRFLSCARLSQLCLPGFSIHRKLP